MKILVTYVSAGSGHKKIADSITAYLKTNFAQHEVLTTDALNCTNIILKKTYCGLYDFLVNHAKWVWRICFWVTDVGWLYPLSRTLMFFSHRLTAKGFERFLLKEQPDVVVSTHFLPSEITAYLKKRNKLRSSLITVITDYGVHSYWINERTELYAVASSATKEILISKGVKNQCIRVTGLPVKNKFIAKHNQEAIRKRLNIKDGVFTALVMTGSFGIGPIEKIVKCLQGKAQLLVVCAKNDPLFKGLNRLNFEGVKVFGFIDYVYELMAVSDIIITKPGGSTISEILAMSLVPVFISAIPGQEYENARVLNSHGIGITPKSIDELKSVVLDYKAHPEKITAVKIKMKEFFIPHADSELAQCFMPK